MKILLATEGSKYSQAAIDKCCELFGSRDDAEIRIVAVYELMIPPTEPFAISAEYIQQVDAQSRQQAEEIATLAAAQLREKCPALTNKLSVKVGGGSPEGVIVEEAEEWGADLIVVGSHGYGFWKRAWLGSVSNAVVHHAPCSVLIVRGKND
jgi:nucleotide-binding universal stress UspA family protein